MSIRYQLVKNISQAYILNNLLNLTFPPFDKKTKTLKVQEPMLGVVARDDDKIIGAIIFEAVSQIRNPEILSFFVEKEYRNKGVGSELFTMANKVITKANIREPLVFFRSNWKAAEKTAHLLKKHGWTTPVPVFQVYKSSIREFSKVKWPSDTTLPEPYQLVNYAEIKTQQKIVIQDALKEKKIPHYLFPFHKENYIQQTVSSFLLYEGSISGWLIGYRNTAESVEYNNLFLFPEHRKKITLPMVMLHNAISKQLQENIPEGIWIIQASNTKMIAYIERYFAAAIKKKEIMLKSVKK